MTDTAVKRYETRAVLAAAYPRGSKGERTAGLTHTLDLETGRVLCGRVRPDHVADRFAHDTTEVPSCLRCERRDPRFRLPSGPTPEQKAEVGRRLDEAMARTGARDLAELAERTRKPGACGESRGR